MKYYVLFSEKTYGNDVRIVVKSCSKASSSVRSDNDSDVILKGFVDFYDHTEYKFS